MKKCPYCAEEIHDEAIVCRHCGRDLQGGASQVQIVQPKKKTGCVAAGYATILVLLGIGWLVSIFSSHAPTTTPTAARKVATEAIPRYRVFDRMRISPADKARDAASIARQRRADPSNPNFTKRKPTDLVLLIAVARAEPDGCLAITKDVIRQEELTTETVRLFFYRSPDLKAPTAALADYNIEWSRADGFHAGGFGRNYHALDPQ